MGLEPLSSLGLLSLFIIAWNVGQTARFAPLTRTGQPQGWLSRLLHISRREVSDQI